MTMAEMESRLSALEVEVAELRGKLEKAEIAAAMKRSREQFDRGECVPAVEAVKAMGRKYGIARE